MKGKITGAIAAAGVVALGMAAFAQGAAQQPPSSPAQSQASASASADQITVIGCVQKEEDYRKAHDAGRAGVAGTGVGAGNEFVLTEVTAKAGGAAAATAYEMTGPNEGNLSQYVGRRVEVTGKIKAGETTASGQPTGGATAGRPPTGVDVASKDLKLHEFEITSVKESTGSCASIK